MEEIYVKRHFTCSLTFFSFIQAVTQMGYSTPTPIQASTIATALKGKDICACAATGTGKREVKMLLLNSAYKICVIIRISSYCIFI